MTSTDSLLSPESTVTSLLASSGHLKSSLLSDSSRSITYGDRQYESATEALDAYIADFQRSLWAPNASTGTLQLPKDPVAPVLSGTRLRNKDVLKEKLTDRELDFLSLPAGTQRRDPDRLSLTTDDLVVLPADGSMPVTRTSAYLTQRAAHPWDSDSRSLKARDLSAPQRVSQGRRVRGREFHHRPKGNPRTQRGLPDAGSAHRYPRWLASLQPDADFSGVSGAPDLSYPAWPRDGEETSDPNRHGTACGKEGRGRPPKAPSWLGDLEGSCADTEGGTGSHERAEGPGSRTPREETGPPTLRELRLDFEEQLAFAEGREGDVKEDKPFRDDKIGSLILKAEKALASPSLGQMCHAVEDGCRSPYTEDILDLDRSWDKPAVTFKSPVPVGGAEDQCNLNKPSGVRKTEADGPYSSGYISRKHPGPVEALKQMLFSLQAVEQRATREQGENERGAPPLATKSLGPPEQHQEAREKSAPREDYESAPGGQSLQRALLHLGRLKSLVDDMNDKKGRAHREEKDA